MAASDNNDVPVTREEFNRLENQISDLAALVREQLRVTRELIAEQTEDTSQKDKDKGKAKAKEVKRKVVENTDDAGGAERAQKRQSLDRDFIEIVKQTLKFEQGMKGEKWTDPIATGVTVEQVQGESSQEKPVEKMEVDASLIPPRPEVQKVQSISGQTPHFNDNNGMGAPARGRQYERGRDRLFTPLGEPLEEVLKILLAKKKVTLRPPPKHDPNSKSYDPSQRCAFHSYVPGHSTEKCFALKHIIQDLIDAKEIVVAPDNTPNVDDNPLPKHDAHVNMLDFVDDGFKYKYLYRGNQKKNLLKLRRRMG